MNQWFFFGKSIVVNTDDFFILWLDSFIFYCLFLRTYVIFFVLLFELLEHISFFFELIFTY